MCVILAQGNLAHVIMHNIYIYIFVINATTLYLMYLQFLFLFLGKLRCFCCESGLKLDSSTLKQRILPGNQIKVYIQFTKKIDPNIRTIYLTTYRYNTKCITYMNCDLGEPVCLLVCKKAQNLPRSRSLLYAKIKKLIANVEQNNSLEKEKHE